MAPHDRGGLTPLNLPQRTEGGPKVGRAPSRKRSERHADPKRSGTGAQAQSAVAPDRGRGVPLGVNQMCLDRKPATRRGKADSGEGRS